MARLHTKTRDPCLRNIHKVQGCYSLSMAIVKRLAGSQRLVKHLIKASCLIIEYFVLNADCVMNYFRDALCASVRVARVNDSKSDLPSK